MNISAANSPSFGKLKVNTDNMSYWQTRLSDQLDRKLKNSNSYAQFEDEPMDVYILPKKNSNEDLEIRYADPYSGKFYRENKKIIKQEFNGSNPFETADKIAETLGRISRGEIKTPQMNKKSFIKGTTDVFKMRPELHDDFIDDIDYWKNVHLDDEDAFEEAYHGYIQHNVNKNKDEDF